MTRIAPILILCVLIAGCAPTSSISSLVKKMPDRAVASTAEQRAAALQEKSETHAEHLKETKPEEFPQAQSGLVVEAETLAAEAKDLRAVVKELASRVKDAMSSMAWLEWVGTIALAVGLAMSVGGFCLMLWRGITAVWYAGLMLSCIGLTMITVAWLAVPFIILFGTLGAGVFCFVMYRKYRAHGAVRAVVESIEEAKKVGLVIEGKARDAINEVQEKAGVKTLVDAIQKKAKKVAVGKA
jgi:hypothetical protein